MSLLQFVPTCLLFSCCLQLFLFIVIEEINSSLFFYFILHVQKFQLWPNYNVLFLNDQSQNNIFLKCHWKYLSLLRKRERKCHHFDMLILVHCSRGNVWFIRLAFLLFHTSSRGYIYWSFRSIIILSFYGEKFF